MENKLVFEEVDHVGESTLDVIAKADRFNQWMYRTISPFLKGKILEVGSGIGNISRFVLEDGHRLMMTDIRKGYCEKLDNQFQSHSGFLGTEVMDLVDPDFETKYADHLDQYDAVFALNVVEHIHDDVLALANSKKLLKKGGKLVVLVPSYQFLFNKFDEELGHYRRYTKARLQKVFLVNHYKIIHKQYFNFIGMFGWFVTGSLMKKESIPGGQMKLYNMLVPVFKVIDRVLFRTAGLSTIIVGEK